MASSLSQAELDTALFDSVYKDSPTEVSMYLEAGANVNSTDEQGFTVLANALSQSRLPFINLLLSKGAVINLNLLHQDLPPPALEKTDDGAMLKAIRQRDWDKATTLLEKGANENAVDEEGFTILVNTLASYQTPVVEILLVHGAQLHAVVDDTWSH